MLDQIRSLLQSVSGAAEIPRQQAERLARDIAKQSGATASMVSGLAEDIMRRSRDNVELVRSLIVSEVRNQVKSLGLATRDDLDRLSRRIRDLERTSGPSTSAAKPKRASTAKSTKPKPTS
jgi:polyhydroxyalkanoate synthesis regulator phasin